MTGRSVLGEEGERAAARFLEARGYRILERNYRTRRGEIDLIAEDGRILVFVEVKVRLDDRFGGPAAAITRAKQARIARLAQQYLVWRRVGDRPCPRRNGRGASLTLTEGETRTLDLKLSGS